MSQHHLNRLSAALTSDTALQSQLQAAKNPDEVVRIANQLGYAITLDELNAKPQFSDEGELSDAELEGVSGGLNLGSAATESAKQANLARDRKKTGADNIQKLLDIVRSMNPQL